VNLKWSGWQQELVHQTPQPPQSAKPTNWGSWRKKTAVYSLKEMIIDPCSNHLLIDTRSKEDFDRSHAWTAIEVSEALEKYPDLTGKDVMLMSKTLAPRAELHMPEKTLTELLNPKQELAKRLEENWAWLQDLSFERATGVSLRQNVTSSRVRVQDTLATLHSAQTGISETATRLTTPPPMFTAFKDKFLAFRRDYRGFLLVGITLCVVAPAALAKGRVEKLRVFARNFFFGGGAAAVLFNPELVQDVEGRAQQIVEERKMAKDR